MAQRKQVLWSSSCWMDRHGLHSCSWASRQMQATIRSVRRQTRDALKKEDYDRAQDVTVSAGYLD
jgi:hypothetical protein